MQVSASHGHSPPEAEFAAAAPQIEDALRAFASALRSFRLYEGRSPALDRFLQIAHDKFLALWEQFPLLRLQIDERSIRWNGERVFPTGDSGSELAFLFYKDGIREIVLLPGFEGELTTLLWALARANQVRAEEDDLITLLWQEEFHFFHYQYVETSVEGVDLGGGGGTEASPIDPGAVREAARTPTPSIRPEDFQETLYFLDAAELERLEEEIRKDAERDLWEGVLSALFDRLEDGTPDRQQRIVDLLTELLPSLIVAGKFDHASVLLSELAELASRPGLFAPRVLKGVRGLFSRLAAPDTINQMLDLLQNDPDLLQDASLGQFLGFLPPEALSPLARAVRTIVRPDLRRRFDEVVERLARQNRAEVVRLLNDEDPELVAAALRWAGELGIGAAASGMIERLRHPAVDVRLAAVEGLIALRASTAGHALQGLLHDPEREVRIAATRALVSLGVAGARLSLESALQSKRLRGADRRERIAFFEAYGVLAGADAIPLLDRTLNSRSWLGRGEDTETRACAALALARIRHPGARKSLQSAAADSDPVVRSTVARALRGEDTR